MKRWLLAFAASAVLVFLSTNALSQQTQLNGKPLNQTEHDINQVQRDYYAIPYGMQLTALTQAAKSHSGKVDDSTVQPLVDASLVVSLSDIKAGNSSDIKDRPWTDFVTIPASGQDVVYLDAIQPSEDDYYGTVKAHWGPWKPKTDNPDFSLLTTDAFLTKLSDTLMMDFTRYVSYTVTLQFEGRSVSYKAMYLFSADDPIHGHQIVDLFLQGSRYSDSPMAYRPDKLLVSKWREIPAIHDWLSSHTTADDSCSQMNQLCCPNGRCAIRRADYDRKMSVPVMYGSMGPGMSYAPSKEWQLPMTSVVPLDQNCVVFSPDSCACDDGSCVPLVQPYSTSPAATCLIITHIRQVYVAWLPTGKYHNWIVSNVHKAGYTNQIEIFDGGPTGTCPVCGNVAAYADLPPEGHESGDTSSGGGWHSSGTSSANCSALLGIQSYIFSMPVTAPYLIWGPNSNTVVSEALNAGGLLTGWPLPPNGGYTGSPGWGMD